MNAQGTSFIPQRPTNGKTAPRRTRKIYVLAYLSYVLFFGSLLATAGVFFFNLSLDAQLGKQQQALNAERDLFNQGDIESIRDLEKRIGIAEERLNNHVSVLSIFEALEASAVQSIYFTSFSYQRQDDEFPLVTFTGDSSQFNNILFQREIFANNPILAGSEFKEVTLKTVADEETGSNTETVQFTLEKEVDTSLIGYTPRQGLSGAEVLPQEQMPPEAQDGSQQQIEGETSADDSVNQEGGDNQSEATTDGSGTDTQ